MSEINETPKYVEILDKIKTNISGSSQKVLDAVVEARVKVEIEKRQDSILKALDEISKADSEIKKIKPDQESFDADGKLISSTFTKAKSEELKKAKKRLTDLDEALSLALATPPDFSKLNNLIK